MNANVGKLDSWIEVPSKHSSISLASSADEVVTHGLRVGNSEPHRRQRHNVSGRTIHQSLNNARPKSTAGSSQDEYTESESESDQVLSSTEALSGGNVSENQSDAIETDEDDTDENATALGTHTRHDSCFTPQPNAFSHPPASLGSRTQPPNDSYFPPMRPTTDNTASRRASFPAQQARQVLSPQNATSSPYQPDHDAALRASLTTLLSCAAAARNLPKPGVDSSPPPAKEDKPGPAPRPRPKGNPARIDTNSLRIVAGPNKPTARTQIRQISSSPSRSSSPSEKGKRKATRSSSKDRRAAKRLRAVGADEVISPTLLTWVVSASVLALVGVLSFSAGVTVGKEAEKLQSSGWAGLEESSRRGSRTGLGLRRRLLNGAVRAVAA